MEKLANLHHSADLGNMPYRFLLQTASYRGVSNREMLATLKTLESFLFIGS